MGAISRPTEASRSATQSRARRSVAPSMNRFPRQSFEETVEAAKKRVGGIEAALAAVGRCRNHRQPSRQPSGFRIRIGNFESEGGTSPGSSVEALEKY